MKKKLSDEAFCTLIDNAPLVSLDFIVKNDEGQILLGQRLNRPAQGCWFVPGGRIFKDEDFASAFERLTHAELGSIFLLNQATFLGPYQHFYHNSYFSDEITTHYVVLAYELIIDISMLKLPETQHGKYKWFTQTELMSDSLVHQYTKDYFITGNR
ncbi:GDP-mannose mannosyl hydrolase [Franconibacter pulveris]|uniref:GDP-mannose mannosyl hydrolase n=1 Tax=Franconibacter pulveris TaxID=435910 RepID=UPI00055D7269|nr:GDP-mannose mannosyl hydrolase [Franconibacter pulveris]